MVGDLTATPPILTRLLLLQSMMLSQLLDDDRDAKFARLDYFDVIDNLNSYLRRTYDQTLELVLHTDPARAVPPNSQAQGDAVTGAAGARRTVSLDSLSARLTTAAATARRLRAWPPDAWADVVTERLVAAATPVFDRRRPLDDDTATAIRIAALCLAAEVDDQAEELSSVFREVAAGVTLLQGRATGG